MAMSNSKALGVCAQCWSFGLVRPGTSLSMLIVDADAA
jgi:hypothetical protein